MPELLDLRGLKCPLVVLRVRRAMGGVAPGEMLAVLADDPMALVDLPVMCHHARLELLEAEQAQGGIRFAIRKPPGYVAPARAGPIK